MIIDVPSSIRKEVQLLGINVGAEPTEGLERPTIGINIALLTKESLDAFYALLQRFPEARGARVNINSYRRGVANPEGNVIDTFKAMSGALTSYLVVDAIEGWIFEINENPTAHLVTGVNFHPAVKKKDYEQEAYIEIKLLQNHLGETTRNNAKITQSAARRMTASQILAAMGYQKETEELHELYDEELERFKKIRPMYGKQLVMRKTRVFDPEASSRRGYYYGDERKKNNTEVDLKTDNGGRLIQDQPMKEGSFGASSNRSMRFDDPDNPYIDPDFMAFVKANLGDTEAFSNSPHVMTLNCYHLGQHTNVSFHVREIEVYKYNDKIRESLILPAMYNEVLDVLTHDMLLVQDDVIAGKTGGNVILLAGPPGTGKTLTAEVYAEFRQVPLLKIHSGQLGTEPKGIEQTLLGFYKRATNWGVPVLLDEFDVFGRARGDNLIQNAVVAVFLRTLEYQNNTIFLTTNRADDMDDAILSRCAAIIKYQLPEGEELKGIWETQRDQFLKVLTDDQIRELMVFFHTEGKKMSGRDVKAIMRLADRYLRTGREITVDLMKVCAGFRGV